MLRRLHDHARHALRLADAVTDAIGGRSLPGSRQLGVFLNLHRARSIEYLRLVHHGYSHGVARWRLHGPHLSDAERASPAADPANDFPANDFPANDFPANDFPANDFPDHLADDFADDRTDRLAGDPTALQESERRLLARYATGEI